MCKQTKIRKSNRCLLFVKTVAFAIAMLNFAGCGDGRKSKTHGGRLGVVACEEFLCDRLRFGDTTNNEGVRKEQAMRLSFSKTDDGVWQCNQNRQPLVSTEFVLFVWRQYAAFAQKQANRSDKNLHFILSFPPSMPCGLHHFTLSAFEVMGVPIAYTEYPIGDITNYTVVSSQLDNPEFSSPRTFVEKSTETLHQIAISKGILIRTFKQSTSDNEAYLLESGLPCPATNVQDFIEILTKDKNEGVFTINSFSGIITFESPTARKPQGISEIDRVL